MNSWIVSSVITNRASAFYFEHKVSDTSPRSTSATVCSSVLQHALQCVAVCCGVLQCVVVCCSVLQCVVRCSAVQSVLQGVTSPTSTLATEPYRTNSCHCVLQCVAVRCSVLQCVAVCCSAVQCVAVCVAVWHEPGKHSCHSMLTQALLPLCVAVRCSALQCVALRCSVL